MLGTKLRADTQARTSKCLGVNLANGNKQTTPSIVTGSARPDQRR